MIDSLELKIPPDVEFRYRWSFIKALGRSVRGMATVNHYRVDLRKLGLSAIFHSLRRSNFAYEKLAFIGTGSLSYTEMQMILEDLLDCDPRLLSLSRIDFAVDVVGTPMTWFHRHVIAPGKRYSCEYGRFSKLGRAQIETLLGQTAKLLSNLRQSRRAVSRSGLKARKR